LAGYELHDDEAEPGAVIRRPGQPVRRVIGLLEVPEEDRRRYEVLIVERV
jgi:hypothetical protein